MAIAVAPASTPAASEPAPGPPGYVKPHVRAKDDVTLPITAVSALLAAALGAAVIQLAIEQPRAFLLPSTSPSPSTSLVGAAVGAAVGLVLTLRTRQPQQALCPTLVALSLWVSASGALWAQSFAHGGGALTLALVLPAGGTALCVAATGHAARSLGPLLRYLPVLDRLVRPFTALATIATLGAATAVATGAGIVRTAAAVGMALAAASLALPSTLRFLGERSLPDARFARAASAVAFTVGLSVFGASIARVPLAIVGEYGGVVLLHEKSARRTYVVTSGQDAYELWLDGRLRISSLDEQRYFEALVQPAMASAHEKRRVLLLGGGTGLAEREVLRHPEVADLTAVNPDRLLSEICRGMQWTRQRSRGTLSSPRLRLVEAEPIVWLSDGRDPFDVAIVDLPDPVSYLDGKNYTVHFFRLLKSRIAESGVIVVQATSAFVSPRATASIEASMRAAGLSTRRYSAPVPTIGEWTFILAAAHAAPEPNREALGHFLSGASPRDLLRQPADVPTPRESPNRLFDQRVVHVLDGEGRAAGF